MIDGINRSELQTRTRSEMQMEDELNDGRNLHLLYQPADDLDFGGIVSGSTAAQNSDSNSFPPQSGKLEQNLIAPIALSISPETRLLQSLDGMEISERFISCSLVSSSFHASTGRAAAAQEKIRKQFELTREEVAIVDEVMQSKPNHVITNKFETPITSKQMQCLRAGRWLNDEVINHCLELLGERSDRAASSGTGPNCYFFNTFFYEFLARKDGRYSYENVKRWTRGKNSSWLEKDLVLIPVHAGAFRDHWCLAVIDMRKKLISYYDSLYGNDDGCLRVCLLVCC
jgi:Ulp1 family protease